VNKSANGPACFFLSFIVVSIFLAITVLQKEVAGGIERTDLLVVLAALRTHSALDMARCFG